MSKPTKPPKPKQINWVAVQAEYEAGGVTLQQLADRLGVSSRTVERQSSKHSWRQGVGKVSQQVSEKVSEKVRERVVAQRVEKALSDLDIINHVIKLTYDAIIDRSDNFKTTGENIAALDRMLKTKLEYSDEHIQKWLLDRGYVAVPITEIQASTEMGSSTGDSPNAI